MRQQKSRKREKRNKGTDEKRWCTRSSATRDFMITERGFLFFFPDRPRRVVPSRPSGRSTRGDQIPFSVRPRLIIVRQSRTPGIYIEIYVFTSTRCTVAIVYNYDSARGPSRDGYRKYASSCYSTGYLLYRITIENRDPRFRGISTERRYNRLVATRDRPIQSSRANYDESSARRGQSIVAARNRTARRGTRA